MLEMRVWSGRPHGGGNERGGSLHDPLSPVRNKNCTEALSSSKCKEDAEGDPLL